MFHRGNTTISLKLFCLYISDLMNDHEVLINSEVCCSDDNLCFRHLIFDNVLCFTEVGTITTKYNTKQWNQNANKKH